MIKRSPSKAFSFLEISVVIMIIGLLISAILTGSEVSASAKLVHARSLTQNSPVASISGLALWLDTTSEKSFSKLESKEGSAISRWNDINPEASVSNYLSNSSGTTSEHPTYKETCINGLPCLYFNGTTNNKITSPKQMGIRTKYISMFLVFTGSESATASYASSVFSSNVGSAWDNNSGAFILTTVANSSKYFFYNMPGNYGVQYTSCTPVASMNPKQGYIYGVIDDSSSSIFHYVNGVVANSVGANSGILTKTLGVVSIGNGSYQGNIGEVIIFTKALTANERKSVEQYLGKKWGIAINS
jgi:hypothetical protein